MTILIYPNPQLRQKALPVEEGDKNLPSLLRELSLVLEKREDGIGLAAPQCGISKQIFLIKTINGIEVYINPKIVKKSFFKKTEEEGCLSVPNMFGKVRRCVWVVVEATDENRKTFRKKTTGLLARVIQHEYDHLQGVLFIDRAKKVVKIENSSSGHSTGG